MNRDELEYSATLWEQLAREDPLWAVLTHPEKRGGKWNVAEFFATGQRDIDWIFDVYIPRWTSLRPSGKALDFGCGVGRVTQALAPRFKEVTGVDVAPSMIRSAEKYNRFTRRCRYLVNTKPDLSIFTDNSFDFVWCFIVLQHIPPPLSTTYLNELLRVLQPGGLCIIQLPGKSSEDTIKAWERKSGTGDDIMTSPSSKALILKSLQNKETHTDISVGNEPIPMFGISFDSVLDILSVNKCRLLHHELDGSAEDAVESRRYLITKD